MKSQIAYCQATSILSINLLNTRRQKLKVESDLAFVLLVRIIMMLIDYRQRVHVFSCRSPKVDEGMKLHEILRTLPLSGGYGVLYHLTVHKSTYTSSYVFTPPDVTTIS